MSTTDHPERATDGGASSGAAARSHLRSRAWWIAGCYALFATLWIYFSDRALAALIPNPEQMIQVSVYKGWGFVAITTVMLLLMMRKAFGALEDGYEVLKAHEVEIERLKRLYAALCQINQAIVWTPDRDELLRKVCQALVEFGGFHMAWVGWHSPETQQILPVAEWGDANSYLKSIQIYSDERPEGSGPTGTVFREGRPYICNDIRRDISTLPWREEARRRNLRASAVFPIRMNGQVCGTLSVYADEVNFFQDKEVALLAEAAVDVSFALDNFAREEARVATEARYRLLFEYAPDGIVIADSKSTYLDANASTCRMLGYTREELVGLNAEDIVVPTGSREIESALKAIHAKADYHHEWLFRRKDGSIFPVDVMATLMPDGNMLGMIRDITERKEAETVLRDLNETLESKVTERTSELAAALVRAEAADQIKSAFLATMSHELRTPLNSIIGFTGIVLQGMAGPLNEEQSKQLGMVRASARHLLELINDVLDLSKIEAGQLEVRASPFDLRTSIEHVVASVKPMAEKKGLELVTALSPELGEMINDRRRVEQILLNLLNNAIKFTDSGRVTLNAEILEACQAFPRVSARIQVADTGIGIKPEDLGTLFQPFRQIDTGLSRQHEGTGLGLAICRRLAALMGGEISAVSEWSRGSAFTVILPLKHPA